MKKLVNGKLISKMEIVKDVFSFEIFIGEEVKNIVAGQFVSVYVDSKDKILPRPISICDRSLEKETITIVFQVLGHGTRILSETTAEYLKILLPLGNGFSISKSFEKIGIIGGGIGVPPMVLLEKEIKRQNENAMVKSFLGFRSGSFLVDRFEDVEIATDDGSVGLKGNVIDLLRNSKDEFDVFYACGPKAMLEALSIYAKERDIPCYVSMEERMACSIGACVGCVIKIKENEGFEYKKVCVDGPVFNSLDVIFRDWFSWC